MNDILLMSTDLNYLKEQVKTVDSLTIIVNFNGYLSVVTSDIDLIDEDSNIDDYVFVTNSNNVLMSDVESFCIVCEI